MKLSAPPHPPPLSPLPHPPPAARCPLQEAGLFFVGTDERLQRMEVIELDQAKHPFFWGCQ